MGPLLTKLRAMFWNQEMEITLVGLQNAGKTTLLNVISDGRAKDTIPTVGLNTRKVQKGNVSIKLWDIGGQPRFRGMWERYCRGVNAIVFVVDASDTGHNVEAAQKELRELMDKPALQNIPLLVLGNKNDIDPHMNAEELKDKLGLSQISGREVCVYSISAKNAVNIDVTLQWLIKHAGGKKS